MPSSPPPLASSYPTRIALVLLALSPNIVLGGASELLRPGVQAALHTGALSLSVVEGMSNAGYAFGAVLAVALGKRHPPRRLLLAYEALFVVGAVLAATAAGLPAYSVGRVLEGFATGMLLVAALPPLVTGFPVRRLATTVAVIDVGLFGAVTLGAVVGGLGAGGEHWRLVQGVAAGVGLLAMLSALASVARGEPLDPTGHIDRPAVYLAAGATTLPFLAGGLLVDTSFRSLQVLVPLLVGMGLLVTLVVGQYRRPRPLTPVRLISHTVPLTGLLAAMFAGSAAVAMLSLLGVYGTDVLRRSPTTTAANSWPLVVGVALASVAFAGLFRSRLVPVLINIGMLVLAGSAAGLALLADGSSRWSSLPLLAIELGVGFGAGAAVAPGLFQAALSVPSQQLGPAFALVELLRSEAAFLSAPLLIHLALSSQTLAGGVATAAWTTAGIAVFGTATILLLPVLSGLGLSRPDLPAWVDDGEPAVPSPPLLARLR